MKELNCLHHITLCTGDAQEDYDFHTRVPRELGGQLGDQPAIQFDGDHPRPGRDDEPRQDTLARAQLHDDVTRPDAGRIDDPRGQAAVVKEVLAEATTERNETRAREAKRRIDDLAPQVSCARPFARAGARKSPSRSSNHRRAREPPGAHQHG